jgi:hypothetical protein
MYCFLQPLQDFHERLIVCILPGLFWLTFYMCCDACAPVLLLTAFYVLCVSDVCAAGDVGGGGVPAHVLPLKTRLHQEQRPGTIYIMYIYTYISISISLSLYISTRPICVNSDRVRSGALIKIYIYDE